MLSAVFAVAALAALPPACGAVEINEDIALVPSDGSNGDKFGNSVAVSGGILLAGAPFASPNAVNQAGAVYAFLSTDSGASWTEEQILTASDKQANDNFGAAVGVSGSVAVVGANSAAPGGVHDAGAVYVYVTADGGLTWSEEEILTASDKFDSDFFGAAVAIDGNSVAVGAPFADPSSTTNAGQAYVFTTSDGGLSWTQQAILIASDFLANDEFGSSIAIAGSLLVVGAPDAAPGAIQDAGAAYVFKTSNGGVSWDEEEILTASDKADSDVLGNSVDIDGDYIVVGAQFADPDSISSAGKAYVFVTADGGATWDEKDILVATSPSNDRFGKSVAVSGDRILVGAHYRHSFLGAVSVFETSDSGTTWVEVSELTASGFTDEAGSSVALDAGFAVAGAPDGLSSTPGTVLFALVGTPPQSAGSGGDPVFVDFAGHRFMAGDQPGAVLPLLSYGRDRVLVKTGTVRGREHGYFLDTFIVIRDGAGSATVRVVPSEFETVLEGDPEVVSSFASGDNGLEVVAVANGEAVLAVIPHASNGFTFLNVKVLQASSDLRSGCKGMLCDETHVL